jgi:folate-binding protein YgfZ
VTTQAPATTWIRTADAERRGVIAVGGPDAPKFLDDLLTANVSQAGPGRAVYAGLLSPQGKVLFDAIVFRAGDDFLLDVARAKAAELAQRLGFYRLRANVTIADRSADEHVSVVWNLRPGMQDFTVYKADERHVFAPDPRLPELGYRIISNQVLPANALQADYDAHRIALGVPEGGVDFAFGDVFPHDVDMDQLAGVEFTKGCFVGQEVVSRMEHRHTARRRCVTATLDGSAPAPGTEILAAGKPVGTLGSSAGHTALALVRLDRAREAMDAGQPLIAGGATVSLSIPAWARFGWPTAAAAAAGDA